MIQADKKAPEVKTAKSFTTLRQKEAIKRIVAKGSKESLAKIMVEAGYSAKTARAPQKLTESRGFKLEAIPLIKRLEQARDKAIERMGKTLDKATYRDTAYSIDVLTKNLQLLTGGATENQLVINISKEIADKNKLELKE